MQSLRQEEVFVFPASFAQQRLWFLHHLAPENAFYNVPAAVRLQGQLDLAVLKQTINEIVQRHESLRTNFAVIEEQLVQVIAPALNLPISVIDLQDIATDEQEPVAKQQVQKFAQQPFNLTQEPLLRVNLLKLHDTEFILLLVLHHIIADGWSIAVLLREFSTLYIAFSQGTPSPLPELPIQYADFACWQREWLQNGVLETQLNYWRQQLQNLPGLNLPTDYPRPAVQRYQGTTKAFTLPPNLTASLETLSQKEGVSLFMTLLAAFQTLLHRYTGQTEIVVGIPIANRNRQELEDLIGFFVNSLVLRINCADNPTFRALLKQVRNVTLNAYAHQDLPFEKLVQDLHPDRDLSRHPLFQVAIALQNTPIQAVDLPGLTLERFEVESGTTRLDLELHLWRSPISLQGQITYSIDLFAANTIDRLLGHFQTLLEGIVRQPNQRLSELPLLTPAEQDQLLIHWNHNHASHELQSQFACIHQLFEAQAQHTPDAIAIVCEDESLSYQALNQRSNQLAHYLQQFGVAPDGLVGICLEHPIATLIALLGILKAGGAYVPLDPAYPQERLEFMLADTQLPILLTERSLESKFTQAGLRIVCLDRDRSLIAQQNSANPSSNVTASHLAYVIYTSGSTGQPKGVLIEHGGIINLAQAQRLFQLQAGDRVLQFASFSFDASVFELVLAIQAGATLYPVRIQSLADTSLHTFLQQHAITVVTLPPAVLNTLPTTDLPALHTVISAGEACSVELANRWTGQNRRCFNAYGPTEATVWATIATLKPETTSSIGHAIPNTQLYVLDDSLNPVPIGIPGELYIGGAGVARGYLNRPELTAEKFIVTPPLPHSPTPPLLYKTGDLVRYCSDGRIEFLGRSDNQVKIRGYRIEVGEIEATLMQHPAVQSAAVIVQQNSSEQSQLVAYVVADSTDFSIAALRSYLQAKLPVYLIPARFEQLDCLPLTPNGKIDRNQLRQFNEAGYDRKFASTPPNSPTEARLAKLWSQILAVEQIESEDNFFDLGGDSLLAMRLMDQIGQQFEQVLPLSTLFQAPTIAQLAALLDQPKAADSTPEPSSGSPLVPFKRGGTKPPFFCVHPIFGVVFPYCELAAHLQADQPFYGLQAIGLDGQVPLIRIEEMAQEYIKAIQSVQPQGPYLLGGWSFGGLVAFEMAQQLQRSGESVALLALLDTQAPIPTNKPSLSSSLQFFLTTLVRSVWPLLLDYSSLLLTLPQTWQNREAVQPSSGLGQISQSWYSRLQGLAIANLMPESSRMKLLDELTLLPMLRIFSANNQAVYHYKPTSYAGQITLFKTTKPTAKVEVDLTLGWNQLTTKPVEVQQVSGNHLSMLKTPNVQKLAQQLQTCIDNAI